MSTATNNIITYKDLTNYALTKIKALCCNIDTDAIPAVYKAGNTRTVKSQYFAQCKGGALNEGRRQQSMPAFTFIVNVNSKNNGIAIVPMSTVTSEFNQFLIDRGINNKPDTVVTFKMITNFFNNMASFVNGHIYQVYSPYAGGVKAMVYHTGASSILTGVTNIANYTPTYTGKTVTYSKPVEPYDPNNANQAYTNVTVKEVENPNNAQSAFTASQMYTAVDELRNAFANVNNAYQAQFQISYTLMSSQISFVKQQNLSLQCIENIKLELLFQLKT